MSFGIPVRNGVGLGLSPYVALSMQRVGGRPALYLDFISTTALPSTITFSRGTSATRVNSSGLIETVAIDVPRFDYDPAALTPKGLLIEEARTNLALQSGSCAASPWVGDTSGGSIPTVTANYAVAPDGTTTATRVQINRGAGTFSRWYNPITAASNTYTASIWMRTTSGSGTANVGLRVDATGVNCIVTGTWQRFSVTTSTVATAPNIQVLSFTSIAGTDVSADVLIWGGQVEAGDFATSYIPTVASTVTRSADVATMTGANFSNWYNQTEGTFVVQADSLTLSSVGWLLTASDGTTSNRFGHYRSSANLGGYVVNATVTQMDLTLASVAANTPFKSSVAAILNSGNVAFNGAIAAGDTSITMPTLNKLEIGANNGAIYNGHIRYIAYYNTRLPDNTLQNLTR